MSLNRWHQPALPSYGMLLLVLCGLAFASYLASYVRIPIVPLFARDLGAGAIMVGLINASFLLTSGLLSFPLGVLSDRLGRKPFILGGLALSMATAFLLSASQSPLQLIGIYLLFGTGLAAIGPNLMSAVADASPLSHLGRSYGWYTTALYSGMSLGPALGGWLAQALGFRWLFAVSGLFVLAILGLAVLLLPGEPAASRARPGKAWKGGILAQMWANRPLLGVLLATFVSCFGLGVFVTFAPLHAQDEGLEIGRIGVIFGVQAAVNALSRFPMGRLSDRLKRRWPMASLGLIAVGAAIGVFGLAGTYPQFLLAAFALGIAMAITFPPLGALCAEVVPPENRGLAMGSYNSCIYLGMMASSAAMGGVIRAWGFRAGFILAGLLVSAATAAFYFLIRNFSPATE